MIFAIQTFGCKVNQYESAALSGAMKAAGFTEGDAPESADIIIINSCSVTGSSDSKARSAVRHARHMNKDAVICLIGCYPQAFPESAAETGADIVMGNAGKMRLPDMIKKYLSDRTGPVTCFPPLPDGYEECGFCGSADRTRSFIKIEDGCDRFCSYCIIPYARGRVRSRALGSVREEAMASAAKGHKEIVLVGINLSCYGKDIGLTLADAVEAASVSGIERVRLSSLEPELLDEAMTERLAGAKKLCPHFHLSLQSGCDATLRRMNRHYTSAEYYDIVCRLREKFPDCSVTTDIMVGFAGETDEEFEQSLAFAEKVGFAKIHVFTYSEREGTAAAKRSDHVSADVRAKRYVRMTELDRRLHEDFLRSQVGTTQTVLVQNRTSGEYAGGLTPNYTPVRIYGCGAERHDMVTVEIVDAKDGFCLGKVVV